MVEQIQQSVARLLATSPAGRGLCLIGGYRYRLLDRSARLSRDLDYHWDGDLQSKQMEVAELLQRRLLPEVKRRFGYDGDVRLAGGPGAESPMVRTVELAFWKMEAEGSRIELPVEITRIVCLDRPVARTAGGTVYLTASDADLAESKVIAVLNRAVIEHRDFCDLYLFADHFAADADVRIGRKLEMIGYTRERAAAYLHRIRENRAYHIRAINMVIQEQLEAEVARNIKTAGGGEMVFAAVWGLFRDRLHLTTEVIA